MPIRVFLILSNYKNSCSKVIALYLRSETVIISYCQINVAARQQKYYRILANFFFFRHFTLVFFEGY